MYWVKKCKEYEVEGPRPRGRPKRRGPGERLLKRTVKHVNWTRRMLWIIVNGGSWPKAVKRLCVCMYVCVSLLYAEGITSLKCWLCLDCSVSVLQMQRRRTKWNLWKRQCCHSAAFSVIWNRLKLLLNMRLTRYRQTHTHPFNGPLSGTVQVSRYQNGITNLDFTEARVNEWQWHHLGHIQVCTSLQTDNHTSTSPLSFYWPDALPAAQPTASKHWRHALLMPLILILKTVTLFCHLLSCRDCQRHFWL